ncbi:hypothetical protein OsJ_33248 [Oryza sativa Japonica Group]|uniref:Uncharacterized protein n=2 Tax=Oryza sativa subsp. japonica TaxID=39947 RepID=A3C9E3_ORYSJ|nr:hypothetical protein OsJ_33248 [Oryza sativa Japonica Group]
MEVDDDDDEQQSLAAPLLLDLEAAAAAVGSKPPADDDDDLTTATTVVEKMAAVLSRIRLSWVFLFLLWVYLLNWVRRFTLTYTDGSIWLTTFAVMVSAIPLTELFYIHAMRIEEITEDDDDASYEEASYKHKQKMGRCILRGLLVLAWLFVIDFGRRVWGEVDELLPAIFIVSWLVITATQFLVMAGLYIEGMPPVVSET